MKIIKIIHGYPPFYNAGSEVYSKSICEELSKNNQVFVFTREENPYLPDFTIRKEQINENLVIYLANMAQGKDGFRHNELDLIFSALLNEIKPDVAHIGHLNHLSTGFPLYSLYTTFGLCVLVVSFYRGISEIRIIFSCATNKKIKNVQQTVTMPISQDNKKIKKQIFLFGVIGLATE
jgi:hypothetical protein